MPEQLPANLTDQDVRSLLASLLQRLPQQVVEPTDQPKLKKKASADKLKYLNDEELSALFRAIDQEIESAKKAKGKSRLTRAVRDMAIFELAFHRGLRVSEIGLLQLNHLRLAQKRLYVSRLKNGVGAEYVLTEREVKALKAWMRERGTKPGPLFPSRNNRKISRTRMHELMRRYGAAAGLSQDKQHCHSLRHSAATSLLEHDAGIEEVQDHLGHRDIRSTMVYAKITSKKRTRLGERLQNEW